MLRLLHIYINFGFPGMNFNTKGVLEIPREGICIKINMRYINNVSRDIYSCILVPQLCYSPPQVRATPPPPPPPPPFSQFVMAVDVSRLKCWCVAKNTCRRMISLVPRPTSQLRMDYITATRVVGLVSSCTNFCPVIA